MDDEGLKDAIEAFFEAGKSGDFEEATQAFKDAQRLCKGGECEGEGEEGEGKPEEDSKHGGPLALLITAKKK